MQLVPCAFFAFLSGAFIPCALSWDGDEISGPWEWEEPPIEEFTEAGQVDTSSAEAVLLSELVGSKSSSDAAQSRVAKLEGVLQPMYSTLPKTPSGKLEHASVRYALHRLFLEEHGWWIKGLDSSDKTSIVELVPEHLERFLEQRSGDEGLSLRELAALATALENFIHKEELERLNFTYAVLMLNPAKMLTGMDAKDLMDAYMMGYLKAGHLKSNTRNYMLKELRHFYAHYADWDKAEEWLRAVQRNVTADQRLTYGNATRIVEAIGEEFGSFNDKECASVKAALVGLEDERAGRVPLSAFYQQGLQSHWSFNEKVEYLRSLGALDESDPYHPAVIVPNYVGSRPQCLEASSFYAVCCRNECENYMGRLEGEIAAPAASPEKIQALVTSFPGAPAILSSDLHSRLHDIAAAHDGQVPIHGHQFAQWMHSVFPRECPHPSEAGTTSPQTPDEWMQETGVQSSASVEEMQCYVDRPSSECGEFLQRSQDADSNFVLSRRASTGNAAEAPAGIRMVSRQLRRLVLSVVALGLALASWMAFPRKSDSGSALPGAGLSKPRKASAGSNWWVTLLLLVLPLSIISVDFLLESVLDFWGEGSMPPEAEANEFPTFFLCWGLAAMIVMGARARNSWGAMSDAAKLIWYSVFPRRLKTPAGCMV